MDSRVQKQNQNDLVIDVNDGNGQGKGGGYGRRRVMKSWWCHEWRAGGYYSPILDALASRVAATGGARVGFGL